MEALILGGLGIVGIVSITLAGYLFHNRLAGNVDRAQEKEDAAEAVAKAEAVRAAVLEKNVAALDSQVELLTTTNKSLVAQLKTAEKLADDLIASIKNDAPSALPAALRGALDRLRTHVKVPDVPAAAAGAASGDPDRGEAGAVHEEAKEGTP